MVLARANGQALGAGTTTVDPTNPSDLARLGAASAAQAASASKTVNINLAGLGATSINVASDADAERLTALLRQIETAAARSGG